MSSLELGLAIIAIAVASAWSVYCILGIVVLENQLSHTDRKARQ